MDIEDFLTAQKESGQVESQGGFTIAVEKARQKLGKFQLDDPGFYLLKVIQAAVWGGASRIEIRTSRDKLALWFDAPIPLGPFDEFWAALRNPLETSEGPFKLLALGFNAGMFSGSKQVSLVWWGAEESRSLLAVGDELSGASTPERPAELAWAANLYMFSVLKSQAGWFKSALQKELDAVRGRCGYCPVEIRIDGTALVPGRPPRATTASWLQPHSLPFWLVERAVPEEAGGISVAGPRMRGRIRVASGWRRGDRLPETFLWQPAEPEFRGSLRCSGVYALPLGLSGPDRVALVRHGVMVATITVHNSRAGAYAVVPADSLSFDLSGFGVVRDGRFEELCGRVSHTWRDMLSSVNSELEHLTSTVSDVERKETEERVGNRVGCGCVSFFLMVILCAQAGVTGDFVFLFGVMAGGGGAYVPSLRKGGDHQAAFQAAVRQRLAELRQDWRR